MIPQILTNAHLVIYVLEACFSDGQRLTVSDAAHQEFVVRYVTHARKLKASWNDIPWILVLNKIDWTPQIPPEAALFPKALTQSIIRCCAPQQIGIPELWKALLRHLPKSSISR